MNKQSPNHQHSPTEGQSDQLLPTARGPNHVIPVFITNQPAPVAVNNRSTINLIGTVVKIKKIIGSRTVLVAQRHLLQPVVLVVVDDQSGGVVEKSGFQFLVEVATSTTHQGDPRHVQRRQNVVVRRFAAVVRRSVSRDDVNQQSGSGSYSPSSVFAQFRLSVSAAQHRRCLLYVHVRYIHLRQRVLFTVEWPLQFILLLFLLSFKFSFSHSIVTLQIKFNIIDYHNLLWIII